MKISDTSQTRPAATISLSEQQMNQSEAQANNFFKDVANQAKKCCNPNKYSLRSFLLNRLPIILWLSQYKCKHFVWDLIAGLAVNITSISQTIIIIIIISCVSR